VLKSIFRDRLQPTRTRPLREETWWDDTPARTGWFTLTCSEGEAQKAAAPRLLSLRRCGPTPRSASRSHGLSFGQKRQAQFARRFIMHGRGRLFTITLLLVFMPIARVNATTVGFRPPVEYPAGTDLRDVVVGDFNGDGNNDVAVANDGGISILLGSGDGRFEAATNLGAGKNPCPFHPCLVSTDFNGDGDL